MNSPYIIVFGVVVACCVANAQPTIQNCTVFPSNNIWNTRIDTLPVHEHSAQYINSIGGALSLRNDFGSGLWDGAPIGIPIVLVGNGTPRSTVTFEYDDESDHVEYPIPPNPPIEGGRSSDGDRHVLMIDTNTCMLYELYHVDSTATGWTAGSGAVFDLSSNTLRPDTWTSADAAGLPIFPGLVRYEEVAAGEINHMIRFTVPKTSRAYLWPARHYASSITDPAFPPMGLVMRLRSTFNVESLQPQARVVARALQRYGMILADNGSSWFMSGIPDERWDMDDLYTLRTIKGADFEAVDLSGLIDNPNSAKVKTPATDVANNVSVPSGATVHGKIITIPQTQPSNIRPIDDVMIFDVVGSRLNVGTRNIAVTERSLSVNLGSLTNGNYLLCITSASGCHTTPLIISGGVIMVATRTSVFR